MKKVAIISHIEEMQEIITKCKNIPNVIISDTLAEIQEMNIQEMNATIPSFTSSKGHKHPYKYHK